MEKKKAKEKAVTVEEIDQRLAELKTWMLTEFKSVKRKLGAIYGR